MGSRRALGAAPRVAQPGEAGPGTPASQAPAPRQPSALSTLQWGGVWAPPGGPGLEEASRLLPFLQRDPNTPLSLSPISHTCKTTPRDPGRGRVSTQQLQTCVGHLHLSPPPPGIPPRSLAA